MIHVVIRHYEDTRKIGNTKLERTTSVRRHLKLKWLGQSLSHRQVLFLRGWIYRYKIEWICVSSKCSFSTTDPQFWQIQSLQRKHFFENTRPTTMGASESFLAAPPEAVNYEDAGFTPSWCAATSWHSHPAGLRSSAKSGPIGWRDARDAHEHDLVSWHRNKRRNMQRRAKILRLQHLQYSLFGRKPTFGSLYGPFFTPFPPIWEEPNNKNANARRTNNNNNSRHTTTTSQEYQRRLLTAIFPQDPHDFILDLWTSYTTRLVSAMSLVLSAITQGGAGGAGNVVVERSFWKGGGKKRWEAEWPTSSAKAFWL